MFLFVLFVVVFLLLFFVVVFSDRSKAALLLWILLIIIMLCHFPIYSQETSAFEELGSEFINFASNFVINTLRLIVYLTGLSI